MTLVERLRDAKQNGRAGVSDELLDAAANALEQAEARIYNMGQQEIVSARLRDMDREYVLSLEARLEQAERLAEAVGKIRLYQVDGPAYDAVAEAIAVASRITRNGRST